MKKKSILITLATFGLLLSGLVGCGKQPVGPSESGKSDETSQKSEESSKEDSKSSEPSSSAESSSSSENQPPHEHSYAKVGESEHNIDGKEVYVMECAAHDDKYIAIKFADYSAIDAAFDADAKASKYGEVEASIWEDAHMLAKTKGTGISWKINVDKAIEGAKLSLGITSTYASHGTTDMAGQFKVKVNDADAVAASITGTYSDNGLDPSKRTYLEFATINLVAGENTIRLTQESTSNRLLFGGEVRVHYSGDAKPVTPFPGYNVTFVPEHCKVLVYSTKQYETETPVETNTCKARDEEGNIVAYDPDDIELQPQVSFKVVPDEGYSVNATNITVTGSYKNLKQNPDSKEGQENIFRITKVQTDLTVTIAAVQGEQAKGYKVSFVLTNCSVKVYVGPKNELGDNLDTIEDGVYYARSKDSPYAISFTTPQVNFEVVCDEGYEFVPVITENKVDFITHPDTTKDGYNKFSDKGGYYNLTKVDDDLTITIAATLLPVAQPVGAFHGLAKTAAATFIPVDLVLAADSAALSVNGEAANVTSYAWDNKDTLTVVTDGAYGTITAKYANKVFQITGLTGAAAAQLDLTFAVQLSGNCQFIDCSVMTLDQMNETFVRRYDRNDGNGWQINKPSDGRISVATVGGRTGLQCNGFSSGKVGFTLKNDLPTPIPGTVIKSVGCWIYNPGESAITMKLFAYKSANRASNGQLNTFTIQPGWHFYQSGVVNGSSFLSTDSFYNFQFFYENVSVNPVFDDLCIYM